MKTVLRFNCGGEERCLFVDSDLAPAAWHILQPHLRQQFLRGGLFHSVVQLDWSCVRIASTLHGPERQRLAGARLIHTSRLIEAEQPTLEALLLAVGENDAALAATPQYSNNRVIYDDDGSSQCIPMAALCG